MSLKHSKCLINIIINVTKHTLLISLPSNKAKDTPIVYVIKQMGV